MDRYVKLGALGQAALEGLVAGVGIALFFALGLRGVAMWTGNETPGSIEGLPEGAGSTAAVGGRRNPAGLVLAVLSFAIAAGIVVVGLYVMVTSK